MSAANMLNPWQYPTALFHRAKPNNTRFNSAWFSNPDEPQNKLQPVRCKSLTICTPNSSSSGLVVSLKHNRSTFGQSTSLEDKYFSANVSHNYIGYKLYFSFGVFLIYKYYIINIIEIHSNIFITRNVKRIYIIDMLPNELVNNHVSAEQFRLR